MSTTSRSRWTAGASVDDQAVAMMHQRRPDDRDPRVLAGVVDGGAMLTGHQQASIVEDGIDAVHLHRWPVGLRRLQREQIAGPEAAQHLGKLVDIDRDRHSRPP